MDKTEDFSSYRQPHMPFQEPAAIRDSTCTFQFISSVGFCLSFETFGDFAYVKWKKKDR